MTLIKSMPIGVSGVPLVKPSQVIIALIETIYKYHPGVNWTEVQMEIGMCNKPAHWLAGGKFCASDATLTVSKITGSAFERFIDYSHKAHHDFEDMDEFMAAVENCSAGVPFFLFKFFGMPEKYVKPGQWWIMLNGNWQEHIHYMGDYVRKLEELGL